MNDTTEVQQLLGEIDSQFAPRPPLQRAVELTEEFVEMKFPEEYSSQIVVATRQQWENRAISLSNGSDKDGQTERLLNTLRDLSSETMYCGFYLRLRAGGNGYSIVRDGGEGVTLKGDSQIELLQRIIRWILDNRETHHGSPKYSYVLPKGIKYDPEEY